jgi:hypothetical protein
MDTETEAVTEAPSLEAVMVAVPSPTARTNPVPETVATSSAELVQLTDLEVRSRSAGPLGVALS